MGLGEIRLGEMGLGEMGQNLNHRKSHMRFRLAPNSSTLDDITALSKTIIQPRSEAPILNEVANFQKRLKITLITFKNLFRKPRFSSPYSDTSARTMTGNEQGTGSMLNFDNKKYACVKRLVN